MTSLPLPKLRSMVRVLLQVGEFVVAFLFEDCFFHAISMGTTTGYNMMIYDVAIAVSHLFASPIGRIDHF